jgi:hypothetical protein
VNQRVISRVITAVIGVLFVALGLWALFSPHAFFSGIAHYPPYNKHLFHDVGAFQIGIGTTMLLALFRRDALGVVLLGTSVGTVLHAISHIIDRNLGGKSSDPITISLIGVAVLVATALHFSVRQR